MKNFSFIIILICFFNASKANDLLLKAEKAYDSKKYKEAIEQYESLLKDGFQSYELHYNLGNAYYRDNQIGRAIYNYEIARKLEPNDEDVKINLSKACAKTIDKIDSKENFFISSVKSNILSSFTTRTWAWLTIYCLIALCVFFYLFMSANSKPIKRTSFIMAMLFLFVFIIIYFLGYSALTAKSNNKFAIILNRESKIYNEPTLTATSKFVLHEGTKIRLVEGNGDWVLIKLDNGNEGWVKKIEIGVI
jgi:tetratricopeptide (TPR) repeat protein